MNRYFFLLLLLLSGCAVVTPLQKSRLIGVFHLIEAAKYEEAKEVVEEMILEKDASGWARTWYARGVLAQTAYQDGRRTNDRKKMELYPDQLYVAFRSFERARVLDHRGRLDRQIAPRYVYLGNEFARLGEAHFKKQEFEAALRAYEHAIRITESPVLTVQTDKGLIYNAALAAFHASNWDRAMVHLNRLNEKNYSGHVAHLLFSAHLQKGDTLQAEKVLRDGIRRYEEDPDLVILLADLHFSTGNPDKALQSITTGLQRMPSNFALLHAKGLIYQKKGEYELAITAFQRALEASPQQVLTYLNIATCYYNLGVEIEENAASLLSSARVASEKARSEEAFRSAVLWLDKLYETQPQDQIVLVQLYELYRSLGVSDRARGIQRLFNGSVNR